MKKLSIILATVAMVFVSCKKEISTNNPNPDSTPKKALLVILDGWGIGDQGEDDVIAQTSTPYFDYLKDTYPHSELQASGEYVGLPDGQMGNSETGHLNIGAGRVIYQDLVMINHACDDNSIMQNPEIQSAYSYAHSTNPVPFIYVTANTNARVQNGVLADVAPTILHIMGLQQPQEMTGQCLINE